MGNNIGQNGIPESFSDKEGLPDLNKDIVNDIFYKLIKI